MKKKVYVLIDCSGSFFESGKRELQTYLVDTLYNASESLFKEIAELSFFTWADTISSFVPYQEIRFGKNTDMEIFCRWLSTIEEHTIVVLLSDGNFCSEIEDVYFLAEERHIKIAAVAVGADSSRGSLAELSTDHIIYEPANLLNDVRIICSK